MLPNRIVDFVQGPYLMVVSTRDDRLFPCGDWAFGAMAQAEHDSVTIFLPDALHEANIRNARSNGKIALVMGHDDGHETYQLKGDYIRDRPCTDEDRAIQEVYRMKLVTKWKPEMGELIERIVERLPYAKSTALTFRVREIFDQTPGPNAGRHGEF